MEKSKHSSATFQAPAGLPPAPNAQEAG
jgi:hypothetical protein